MKQEEGKKKHKAPPCPANRRGMPDAVRQRIAGAMGFHDSRMYTGQRSQARKSL